MKDLYFSKFCSCPKCKEKQKLFEKVRVALDREYDVEIYHKRKRSSRVKLLDWSLFIPVIIGKMHYLLWQLEDAKLDNREEKRGRKPSKHSPLNDKNNPQETNCCK